MSIEKNEVASKSPNHNTEKKLNKLDDSVKLGDSKEAQAELKEKVAESVTNKERKNALKTTENLVHSAEKNTNKTEVIQRPKPEQIKKDAPNFIQRQWNNIVSAPKRAIQSFKDDPAKASIQTGAGIGLAAGAAYLTSGIAIAGSTIAAPIAAGATGLAAGIWAASKGIDAIRKRFGGNKNREIA